MWTLQPQYSILQKKNVIETLAMKTGKKAYKVVVPGKKSIYGYKDLISGWHIS